MYFTRFYDTGAAEVISGTNAIISASASHAGLCVDTGVSRCSNL